MRVSVLSAAALLALVATFASAARAPQCEGLLAKRGGGFFDKLSSKIDSVTKSGTDVSPMSRAVGVERVLSAGDSTRWSLAPLSVEDIVLRERATASRPPFFPIGHRQGVQGRGQGH